MPNPLASDVHVNKLLTNMAISYALDQTKLAADKAFPMLPVDNRSDLYLIWSRGDWFRTDAQERAPHAETVGVEFSFTTGTYVAKVYGAHYDLNDQIVSNEDAVFNMRMRANRRTTNDLLLQRETTFVNTFFGTGKWTGATGIGGGANGADITGGATAGSNIVKTWDLAGSTPIEDIQTQITGMEQLTSVSPNVLIIGPQVYNALRNNSEILARIQYTRPGGAFVDLPLLATALNVDRVLVPHAVKNTGGEGVADAFSFFYGKSALLAYVPDGPGVEEPSAGYIFNWTGYLGTGTDIRTKEYRIEPRADLRIETESAYAMAITAPDLGVFFSGVVS